ncbi:hypothetical protein PIB30_068692 [Stylosanthes scabra]|uniref:Transmembrane protein n=1 Tax=Stylosanthes scabra TaxID=79078 RepID=A0ABU6QNQ5_9FABA|nr:hypothetical protein [Stylosanthes scabra]
MEAGGGSPSLRCLGGKNFRIGFVLVRWRISLGVVMLGEASNPFLVNPNPLQLLLNTVAERKSCVLPMSRLHLLSLVSSFFVCLAPSILFFSMAMFIHSDDSARLIICKIFSRNQVKRNERMLTFDEISDVKPKSVNSGSISIDS